MQGSVLRTVLGAFDTAAFASGLGLVLGLVLIVSGAAKVRTASSAVSFTALAAILGPRRAERGWRILALAELALGIALLMATTLGAQLAVLFFLGAFVFTLVAPRLAPGTSCGCFGSASEPVSSWTSIRASSLLLASALVALGTHPLAESYAAMEFWAGVASMLATVGFLSPELRPRRAGNPNCSGLRLPRSAVLEAIRSSEPWRQLSAYVTSMAPRDDWLEGCFRFLAFSAESGGQHALALFAYHLDHRAPVVVGLLCDPAGQPLHQALTSEVPIPREVLVGAPAGDP